MISSCWLSTRLSRPPTFEQIYEIHEIRREGHAIEGDLNII